MIEVGKKYKLNLKNTSFYFDSTSKDMDQQIVKVVFDYGNEEYDIEDINNQWSVCESGDLDEIDA